MLHSMDLGHDREKVYTILKCLCETGAFPRKAFLAEQHDVARVVGVEDAKGLLDMIPGNPADKTTNNTKKIRIKLFSLWGRKNQKRCTKDARG